MDIPDVCMLLSSCLKPKVIDIVLSNKAACFRMSFTVSSPNHTCMRIMLFNLPLDISHLDYLDKGGWISFAEGKCSLTQILTNF